MSDFGGIPVGTIGLIVMVVLRALASNRKVALPAAVRRPPAVLWWLLAIGWATSSFLLVYYVVRLSPSWPDRLMVGAVATVVLALGLFVFVFAWPVLRTLARRGRPKLVYRLAHIVQLFMASGETRAGATLLAGLALAHRGNVTPAERAWLLSRLAPETRVLGTHAAAYGLILALDARAARDEGNQAEAWALSEKARLVIGTITYFSRTGVPKGVRQWAYEYLALSDAEAGQWGGLRAVPAECKLSPTTVALRGWLEERLEEKAPTRETSRARRRVGSPELESLFARRRHDDTTMSLSVAHGRASVVYLALSKGEPVGPRAVLQMLSTFDVLMHPENPETIIPAEVLADAEMLEGVYEDVAEAIAKSLVQRPAPIHLLEGGVVSSRVYQRVEVALVDELSAALHMLDERRRLHIRGAPHEELLEVAYVRGVYRRLQQSLGVGAASQFWPQLKFSYCNFGVQLAESFPRRRPLAYAIFNCLQGEAKRFEDAEHVDLETKNMAITRGVD